MKVKTDIASANQGQSGRSSAEVLDTILAGHPFLEGLSPYQIRLISDCAMLIQFAPGELIFREGDPANRFYLIHTGKVALESPGAGGVRKVIQILGPGEVLGWSWLFPPYFWHLDARALEPVGSVFFYGTPLREECESDHDLGYELMKRMAQSVIARLQATRRQLLNLHSVMP